MTTQAALDHYNTAKGTDYQLKDLTPGSSLIACVASICEVAAMVERAGGTLRSRQSIAVTIYFAENLHRTNSL